MEPIGELVATAPARRPQRTSLEGCYVRLVPLDPAAHGDSLYEGSHGPGREPLWLYMSDGPYPDRAAFLRSLEQKANATDAVFFLHR